jgi:NADPH:quinone reductase-like Zn-dependent oxidoreductase
MDLIQREGKYPLPPQAGKILGVEFSGTIESFGDDAEKGFKVGDEVFGLAYGGTFSTQTWSKRGKTWERIDN